MDMVVLCIDKRCLRFRRYSIGKFIYWARSLSDYEQT